jgi:hypothetical protein
MQEQRRKQGLIKYKQWKIPGKKKIVELMIYVC